MWSARDIMELGWYGQLDDPPKGIVKRERFFVEALEDGRIVNKLQAKGAVA